ncbi:translocase of outer mitochondrial membrane [Massospora cicadina]|nr:translocase of outer mitochondrial membrane [Massospora cicadina]
MAYTTQAENLVKDVSLNNVPQEVKSSLNLLNPLNLLDRFHDFKAGLKLVNPGSYEEIHSDTKGVFPTNLLGVLQTGINEAQSAVTLEGNYAGPDNTFNIKTLNPSVSTGTGILAASYLQSITKNLALGSEVAVQRPSPEMEDSAMSYVIKYATPQSTFVAQLHDKSVLEASYFRKVSDTAEFAANLQAVAAPGNRDAICTLGAKFEFKQATMRTQIDTTGRVATLLEERIVPPLTLLLSADLDHFKGQSRFGLGVRISI